MSSIAYLHGLGGETSLNGIIDYSKLTDGELSVLLAARQSEILYRGTGEEEYIRASKMLSGLLESIVNGKTFSADSSRLMRWAKGKLRRGNYPALAGGANYLSPMEYRQAEYEKCEKIRTQWENTNWLSFRKRNELRKSWEGCFAAAKYLGTVNSKLAASGAHLMFSFKSTENTQAIATKRVLHNIAVENYSDIFGLSTDNIKMWINNGILEQNVKRKAGTMHAEETINFMVKNVTKENRVGDLLTILAIVKVVLTIIAAAAAATKAILSAMTQADYNKAVRNTAGLDTTAFGPQEDDFIKELVESGALWPLAGAAALLLLQR